MLKYFYICHIYTLKQLAKEEDDLSEQALSKMWENEIKTRLFRKKKLEDNRNLQSK